MVHDHALHELHIRLRAWRQRGPCRWRQRPGGLTRRTRLHHNRLHRISLLSPNSRGEEASGAEETCGSARGEEHATQQRRFLGRVKLALAAKSIKLPLRCMAKHLRRSHAKRKQQNKDEEMRLSPSKSPRIPGESGQAQLEESHATAH